MKSLCRLAFCGLALAGAVSLLGAQEPLEVKDQAGLFKAETIKTANEAVRELAKKGIRLAIETYPTVPKDSIDKVKEMKKEEREKFYLEWSLQRVKDLGENSIVILLTKEPKHLETAIGAEAIKKFTGQDRKALTDAMLAKLRKMEVDDALLEAVATLRKHFDVPAKDNP